MITSNSLQFFSEKLLSDIVPIIFRRNIGGIGDPLPILTSERHWHSERLFLYPFMLPIDLISCKLVLQLFLICTFKFYGLLLLPVPTFLECVALMKSKMSQYLAWHFKMSHFQHLICYLYSIVNKIQVYEICKLLHSFFIHNLYSVPTFFWNRVCITLVKLPYHTYFDLLCSYGQLIKFMCMWSLQSEEIKWAKRLQLFLCKTKSAGENTAFICSLGSEWFLSESHIIEAWDHLYFMVVLGQQHFPKPALTLWLSDTLGAGPCTTSWAPQHLDPHSWTRVQTFTLH